MAFLTLDGEVVPVAATSPAEAEHQEVGGEVVPAFDGALLSTVKGHARVWRAETPPVDVARARTLTALLERRTALTAAGSMVGPPVQVLPRLVQKRPVVTATGTRWVLVVELHEQTATTL